VFKKCIIILQQYFFWQKIRFKIKKIIISKIVNFARNGLSLNISKIFLVVIHLNWDFEKPLLKYFHTIANFCSKKLLCHSNFFDNKFRNQITWCLSTSISLSLKSSCNVEWLLLSMGLNLSENSEKSLIS